MFWVSFCLILLQVLEEQRMDFQRFVRKRQEALDSQCLAISDWSGLMSSELRRRDEDLHRFLSDNLHFSHCTLRVIALMSIFLFNIYAISKYWICFRTDLTCIAIFWNKNKLILYKYLDDNNVKLIMYKIIWLIIVFSARSEFSVPGRQRRTHVDQNAGWVAVLPAETYISCFCVPPTASNSISRGTAYLSTFPITATKWKLQ